MENQVIIHDAREDQWLHFSNVRHIIIANKVDNVVLALNTVEKMVCEQGFFAAGFISYEASPAFDSAVKVRQQSHFPLLWFGIYNAPDVFKLPNPAHTFKNIPLNWKPSVSQTEYYKAIKKIKEYIACGETYQVNYTFRLGSHFSGDAWSLFHQINHSQKAKYGAYIDTGRFVICSASPELFFNLNGNELITRPMKGTAHRGLSYSEDKTQAEWLFNSEKNRAENVMIVDMMRNDIGRIAFKGSIKVPVLFNVERYPTLWQMTSTISAQTKSPVCDIINALFPCASITGAPKPHTTEIIAKLETLPRNIYTGCIGFIAPGRRAQFNVAIRTVLIDREKQQAEYGVGGGIVWDSIGKEEYKECKVKAKVLTKTSHDFSLLETILWTPDEKFFLLEYHLKRLRESAEYFSIPVNIENVRTMLNKLGESLPHIPHKIRMLISQDEIISFENIRLGDSTRNSPVKLRLALKPVDSSTPFLYHKTTKRDMYDSLKVSMDDCDDVLLWNKRNEITETTIANVVVKLNGELLTPPVSCGLLPGTYREWMIDQKMLKERVILIDDLMKSETIYTINSVRKKQKAVLLQI